MTAPTREFFCHILLRFHRRGLEQACDHRREHLDMADFLGADIHDHVAILRRTAARPALEQISHHDGDLAPLATERLLQHLGKQRIGFIGLGVVLQLSLAQEHVSLLAVLFREWADRLKSWLQPLLANASAARTFTASGGEHSRARSSSCRDNQSPARDATAAESILTSRVRAKL